VTEEEAHEGETEGEFAERFRMEKRNFIISMYQTEVPTPRAANTVSGYAVDDCDDA
jgi:hypothetical protein